MLGKQYETENTQVECEETLHLESQIIFCHKLIEEMPLAAAVIITQLYLKAGMESSKGKRGSAA